MTHPRERRVETVHRALRERGFDLAAADRGVVARGGDPPAALPDAPLAVTYPGDAAPLSVVSDVATAAHEGRVPVLVVDEWTADEVRDLLAAPFLLAGRRDGGRRFRAVEDRILLTDDTYAAAPTGPLEWLEEPAASDAGERTDDSRLLLRVGDETVAALEGVDALRCPGPSPAAFPYRYDRADGRFRVREGADEVGRFAAVRTMRTRGYRPVPLPLVPEHHVRSNGRLARAALLARVEDGDLEWIDP